MNIVLCFPVEDRHIAQIQQACLPDDRVIHAGQERIAECLLEADIFCGHAKVPVPWDDVVDAGRLQWIQSSAAGLDHCLVPSVIASDIPVTSASGLFAPQVAEQTAAILLGLVRSMPTFFRAQQKKEFIRRRTCDLRGMTVGIVGFGGNGRQIAKTLAPFGVDIVATDMFPHTQPDHVRELWPAEELPQLLATSDVVIMCVPLNVTTHGMMGAEQFATMKRGAFFVNVARGQVVVEAELVEALASGHLDGAGLDVTEVEPLDGSSPLWEMSNVIITPHVGAQSAKRVDVTVDFFCDNVARFRDRRPLRNLVDKELGFPVPPQVR
jgi:D-3-phosphoglycerate dehydrogenase